MKQALLSLAVTFIYQTAVCFADTWTQKADFGGSARFGVTSLTIGNKAYVGTGYDDVTLFQDFWEFDPQTSAWTQKATFPGSPRFVAVGIQFAIGDKGYFGTGWNGTAQFDESDFWEYNATLNQWTQKAGFAGGERNGAVGFSIGNKGYVGTGWNITTPPIYFHQDFWEYDPQTDTWTQKNDFPGSGRQGAVGFSIGSKGYIGLGGGGVGPVLSNFFNDFWEYDSQSDTWVQKANLPAPGRQWPVGFSVGTKGYIGTGGTYPSGPFYDDFWEWDQANDTWVQKANFAGGARNLANGFSIGTKGYLGTGYDGSAKRDFWEYDPSASAPAGSSCSNAIDLQQGNITLDNLTLSSSGMWFKLIADSSTVLIRAANLNSDPSQLTMTLYEGQCNNLNVLASNPAGDSLGILQSNLLIGQQYLVKISNPNLLNVVFDLEVQNIAATCTPFASCASSPCNLISNGGFTNVTSTATSEIFQSILPCWCCSHGTPQVAVAAGNLTPNYATMYHNGSTGNGEGIITHGGYLNIVSGTTYSLTYYIKRNPASSASDGNFYPIDNVFVILTNSSSSGLPNCGTTGGTIVPNPAVKQIVDQVSSFANASWTKRTIVFQANGNYNQLHIYPRQNFISSLSYNVVWLDVDDISLQTLLADAGPNKVVCSGSSVAIGGSPSASGGTPPYTYNWTPNNGSLSNVAIANPSASPNVNTTYNLLVTDANNCTASDGMVVTVNFTPTAIFSFTGTLCTNNTIQFTAGSGGSTFNWSFGDGGTSTAQNPSHVYTSPGTYVVTLTETAGNGCFFTTTQTLTITSSCCALAIAYDDASPLFNSPITSSTTLPFQATPYRINKTIVIQAPAIWTIPANQVIEFGPFGKIIVENGDPSQSINGAQLVMNFKTKFTSVTNSFPSCPVMWPGVEVHGISLNASSVPLGQGKITMGLFSTIENAHIGVLLGKLSGCIPGPLVKCPLWDLFNCGGIINANNSIFNNNATSIEFAPYNKFNSSVIQKCQFTGGYVWGLDPGYISPNSAGYTYPNSSNPIYAPAQSSGLTPRFIYLWGVRNVNIWDNSFDNAVNGIESYNSRAIIKKNSAATNGNTFNNLVNGISLSGYNSSISISSYINDNLFRDIQGTGLFVLGGNGEQITNNKFHDPSIPTPPLFGSVGIYMNSSTNFFIADNNFYRWNWGMVTTGNLLTPTVGTIGYSQKGNSFEQCKYSVITSNNNLNLQIRCNDFINSSSSFYSGATWDNNNGFLGTQGYLPITTAFDPAGNRFTISNRKQITSTTGYHYWLHFSSQICGNCITPIPLSSNINLHLTNKIQTSTSCNDPCSGTNPPCRIAQMNNLSSNMNNLQTEFNNVFANLDHGQTAQLLSAISSNTSSGNLKNLLLQNSPLSDEVLLAFINKNGTPPGHFKEVIVPNSPVSDDVRPVMLAKISSMPPGISKQVRDAQDDQSNRTITAISREILSARTQYQLALANVITQYLNMDSVNTAITLLENQNTIEADQILANTYLEQGDIVAAENKLNSITATTPDVQAFLDLHYTILELQRDSFTVFDIDSTQEALIRSIAAMPPSLASANAKAILKQVFNEDIPLPNFSLRLTQQTILENGKVQTETDYQLGENFPNPFSDRTTIPYYLPENSGGYISIYDVNGSLLKSFLLKEGYNAVELDTENWSSGVYYYSMEINGTRVSNKKMVLINRNDK